MEIVIVTKNGKGKRLPLKEFIIQNRGGRGSSCISLNSDNYVVAAVPVFKDSSILVVGSPNSICIPASEIIVQSKISSGVEIIENSKVTSAIVI